MKFKNFALCLLAFLPLMAWEPVDPDDGPDFESEKYINLPLSLASSKNYHAHVPASQVPRSGLVITNETMNTTGFYVVAVHKDGTQDVRYAKMATGESERLLPASSRQRGKKLSEATDYYILSLQRFSMNVKGLVIRPQSTTNLVTIETQSGNLAVVEVDEDGSVHYPVYGKKIGIWDPESDRGAVLLKNGARLHRVE